MTIIVVNPGNRIQTALNSANVGDTVQVKTGTYNERIIFPRSGTEGNYITLTNFPDNVPIIDGTNIPIPANSRQGLIEIINKNWITLSGFKIQNSTEGGIRTSGVNNVIIRSNNILETSPYASCILNGYYVVSTNLLIDNNICDRNFTIPPGRECSSRTPMYINEVISCDHIVHSEVKNNQILRNFCGEGFGIKNGTNYTNVHDNLVQYCSDGIYIDGSAAGIHHINAYNNIARNCTRTGIKVGDEASGHTRFIKIYNNLVYNNTFAGIMLSPQLWRTSDTSILEDIEIKYNTVYHNGYGASFPSGGILVPTYRYNNNQRWNRINVFRNLVSNNNRFQIIAKNIAPYVADVTVDANFIQGFRNYANEVRGTNYVEGDPLFINPTNNDFRLQSNSPAIGYGYTTTVVTPIPIVSSVSLNPAARTVNAGQNFGFGRICQDQNNQIIDCFSGYTTIFTSSNTDIATIDSGSGLGHAIKAGTSTITVTVTKPDNTTISDTGLLTVLSGDEGKGGAIIVPILLFSGIIGFVVIASSILSEKAKPKKPLTYGQKYEEFGTGGYEPTTDTYDNTDYDL